MAQTMHIVLEIFELVEKILADVDARTLLTSASRVNRTWHAIINTSIALRQALWLEPDSVRADSDTLRKLNPLLEQAFPVFLEPFSHRRRHVTFRQSSLNEERLNRRIMYPGASWRRMLISKPPIFAVGNYRETLFGPDPDEVPTQFTVEVFPGHGLEPASEVAKHEPEPRYTRPRDLAPGLVGLRMADLYDGCVWELSADDEFEVWFQFHCEDGRALTGSSLKRRARNFLQDQISRRPGTSVPALDAILGFTKSSDFHATGDWGALFEHRFTFDTVGRGDIERLWEASSQELAMMQGTEGAEMLGMLCCEQLHDSTQNTG